MERDEWEQPSHCALCGAGVSDAEGAFAFGAQNLLCAECSMARGGRYDVERDVWDVEPDLTDLSDEAYGTAPHERRGG